MVPAAMDGLIESIIRGDEPAARRYVGQALAAGLTGSEILDSGLTPAMGRVGRMWDDGEAFLPEVLQSAAVFQSVASMLDFGGELRAPIGRCVLGTVRGDLHDLGKNIVAIMMRTAGFEVIDLGRDVPRDAFLAAVRQHKPDVLGMSALLTTTMDEQRSVIHMLREEGLRDSLIVMVGGAPVTPGWAREIGADAYAENAQEAVNTAKRMLGVS